MCRIFEVFGNFLWELGSSQCDGSSVLIAPFPGPGSTWSRGRASWSPRRRPPRTSGSPPGCRSPRGNSACVTIESRGSASRVTYAMSALSGCAEGRTDQIWLGHSCPCSASTNPTWRLGNIVWIRALVSGQSLTLPCSHIVVLRWKYMMWPRLRETAPKLT